MNILYQCNDKYAPFCGVSITSLFENNKNAAEISIFILGEEISTENKDKFQILAKNYNRSITFLGTADLVKKLADLGIPKYRNSYSANFKMFVNEFVPDNVERLLYIDSDTIVSGDLSELFNMDMHSKPIAMAQDSLVTKHKVEIGMQKNEKYYNTGVILFDVNEWKNQKCSERIIEHTKTLRAHYPAPDQDLINIVIREEIAELPPEYNMEPAYYMFSTDTYYKVFKNKAFYKPEILEAAKGNEKIYHFFRIMGEFPWHSGNMHPFNDLFDKYLAISPWKDYQKQPSGISAVFKIEKLMYKYMPRYLFAIAFHFSHIYFMSKSENLSRKNQNNKLM